MTIMTVHIPDDVKAAFDKAFEGEDKNAVIARLLLEAAERRERGERREVSLREAADEVLRLRRAATLFHRRGNQAGPRGGPPLTLVIDASVTVKWALGDHPGEQDTGKAASLLNKVVNEGVPLLQPEHWRVEVLSVVARLAPERFGTLQLLEKLNASRIELDRGS